MEIRVVESTNAYRYQGEHISVPELGNLIRAGNLVRAFTPTGENVTQECLTRIVFNPFLKDGELKVYLEHVIPEDKLIEIIEEGGLENYVLRRKKGLI